MTGLNDYKTVFDLLPSTHRKRIRHRKGTGTNQKLINSIHREFPAAVEQVKKSGVAKLFDAGNAIDTGRNIYDFLQSEIVYLRDPAEFQRIKLPSRVLSDRFSDCKSFALFTAAILAANGYPVKFKYAGYDSRKIPTHVYITTTGEHGRPVVIDGVWKEYNREKPPTFTKIYDMQIESLYGVEVTNTVQLARKVIALPTDTRKRLIKQCKPAQQKEILKAVRTVRKIEQIKRARQAEQVPPMETTPAPDETQPAAMVPDSVNHYDAQILSMSDIPGMDYVASEPAQPPEMYSGIGLPRTHIREKRRAGRDVKKKAQTKDTPFEIDMLILKTLADNSEISPLDYIKNVQTLTAMAVEASQAQQEIKKLQQAARRGEIDFGQVQAARQKYDDILQYTQPLGAKAKRQYARYAKKKYKSKVFTGKKSERLEDRAMIKKAKATGTKQDVKEARQHRRKRIKETAQDVGRKILRGFNMVLLAVGRGAFLALVKANVKGLGRKIAKVLESNNANELLKKWELLGGKKDRLKKAAGVGKNQNLSQYEKDQNEIDRKEQAGEFSPEKAKWERIAAALKAKQNPGYKEQPLQGIGSVTAATAATAAPVLGAIVPILTKLLKKLGIDPEETDLGQFVAKAVDKGKEVADNLKQKYNDLPPDSPLKKTIDAGGEKIADYFEKEGQKGELEKLDMPTGTIDEEYPGQYDTKDPTTESGSSWLIPAAVGLYLFSKQ